MKHKLYSYLLLVLVLGSLASCKSASKMYDKGNYDEAVELAARKLQKKPGDAKLIAIVQDAYRFAIRDHESRIHALAAGSQELRVEAIYREYASLQRLYEAIYHAPEVMKVVEPVDYSSYLVTYAEKTADVYRDRAYRLMGNGDKESFRSAYFDLDRALSYRPGDVDMMEARDEAYDKALTRVVVLPVDDGHHGFRYSRYQTTDALDMDNRILRNLRNNTSNIFVKYYTGSEARGLNIVPDQIVDIRLNTLNTGRMRERKESREVYKDVVIKETVYRPDSVVKEYAKVKAIITEHRRTLSADGTMTLTIRDEQGRRIWSDQTGGSHDWATQFYTYTGDERALTDEDRRLLRLRAEEAPSEREMIQCILSEMEGKLVGQLRDYFVRL